MPPGGRPNFRQNGSAWRSRWPCFRWWSILIAVEFKTGRPRLNQFRRIPPAGYRHSGAGPTHPRCRRPSRWLLVLLTTIPDTAVAGWAGWKRRWGGAHARYPGLTVALDADHRVDGADFGDLAGTCLLFYVFFRGRCSSRCISSSVASAAARSGPRAAGEVLVCNKPVRRPDPCLAARDRVVMW